MKTYAFDVVLRGVVRVEAVSEEVARRAVNTLLDSLTPEDGFLAGFNEMAVRVRLTEVSLAQDSMPHLFDVSRADGLSCIEAAEAIKVGGRYLFDYPREFRSLPVYTAHAGQMVTVLRPLDESEADPPSEDTEGMFLIKADDGWQGQAFTSELVLP